MGIFKNMTVALILVAMLMTVMVGCEKIDINSENPAAADPTQGAITEPAPMPADEPQTEPAQVETPVLTPVGDPGLSGTAAQLIWGGTSISEDKQIALTFDSGWEYDKTSQLLDVLDQYQVKATFFLRGGWVRDHQELAQEIAGRGHLIESHSQAHGHMNAMTQDQVIADITESTAIIENTIGHAPTLFRPPYGEYNNRLLNVLGEQGYQYAVMWTIDSHDWAETMNGINVTEQYLIDRVLGRATDNGIVLMHIGGYQTVNALPEIITGLRNAGYELVTLDEVIPRQ